MSTPVPLALELLNIMIRHPAIQHNYLSTLTTVSLIEQHCNSLNTLPSFIFCCTLTSSLTNSMKSDSTVSTEHPLDLTDRSLDIGIDIDTDVDLDTIASIYVVVNIYTNDIVIPTVSTSIISTIAVTNPGLKYVNRKYSTHKLQESESRVMTTYNLGLPQSDAILCLSILPTIFLLCYHDKARYVAPTIANLSTQMKMARVSLEVEVNFTDYLDALFNQDIGNDIITLRQPGLVQRIIDTLHRDSNTPPSTSTYLYLHPTNNKTFQDSQNYVSIVKMLCYIQDRPCNNTIHTTVVISTSHKSLVTFLIQQILMKQL